MKRPIRTVLFLILFTLFSIPSVHAATVYVNSNTGDDDTGDGSSGAPYATFHKGYTQASASDTLDLTGTFTWTDADETGDATNTGYTLDKNLTIQGSDPEQTIIQAASSDNSADRRVFTIDASATVTIQDLTIRYGKTTSSSQYGGGIDNLGTLTVNNCEVYNNRATGAGGGGINNQKTATITNSAIYDNTVYYMGGGVLQDYNSTGVLSITNSTIYNNSTTATSAYFDGGGVHVRGGTDVIITNSTIMGNSSRGAGGVGIDSNGGTATLFVKNTIIAENTSTSGTADNDFDHDSGTVTDNGYNIVGQSSGFAWEATGDWTDTDIDNTFTLYSVGTTGSLNIEATGGVNDNPNGTKTRALQTSSIAIDNGSTGSNSTVSVPSTDQRGGTRNGTGDIGAFEFNAGGFTITAPTTQASSLVFSSVEYDQVNLSWTNGNGSRRVAFMKQAGTGNPVPVDDTTYTDNAAFGSGTQIGSTGWYTVYDGLDSSVTITGLTENTEYIVQIFEYNGIESGTETYFTDTATNNPNTQTTYDPITLYINATSGDDGAGAGTIGAPYATFHKGYTEANKGDTLNLTGIFTWTDADETGDASTTGYTLEKELTLTGNGPTSTIIQSHASDDSADRRIFTISSGYTVIIQNMTLRHGKTTGSSQYGGAVSNYGTLTMSHCDVYNNRSTSGGGGGLSNDGTATVTNSSFHDNVVYYMGGGILQEYYSTGVLTVTNTTIYNNSTTATVAYYDGGGIHVRGGSDVYLTNNTITGNSSRGAGGVGLDSNGGAATLYMKNNLVSGNTSTVGTTDNDFDHDSGTVTDNGYNIVGQSSGFTWAATGDWTDTDEDDSYTLYSVGTTGSVNLAGSAALNGNAYETYTFALEADSIAIDTGATGTNGSVNVPTTDQRLFSRDETPNIGAYELDAVNPTVSTLSPADDATGIAVDANLVITFNEAVDVESGNITIYAASDDSIIEAIDVTSGLVTGTGTTTITVNPSSDLNSETEFYVQIDATAFDDSSSNSYAGIADTTSWSFTTMDALNPSVSTLSPADDATGIAVDANLIITFSEEVDIESGDITIFKASDDSIIETIDITSGLVTGTGTTTITVDPTSDLNTDTSYYVQIDASAFDDDVSNSYAGINDTSTWNFSTISTVVISSSSGGQGSYSFSNNSKPDDEEEQEEKSIESPAVCTDMDEDYWASTYINTLLETESYQVKTLSDNEVECEPQNKISRADFTAWIMGAYYSDEILEFQDTNLEKTIFPDLESNDSNSTYIYVANELGIIGGHPDGQFRPLDFVNRAEILKIIIRSNGSFNATQEELDALKVLYPDKDPIQMFYDVEDSSAWFYPYLYYATAHDIIQGRTDYINGEEVKMADMNLPALKSEIAKILFLVLTN